MPTDGGLRTLFRKYLPDAMWTSIESGSTAQGIPDSYFCFPYRVMGWVEMKQCAANAVGIRAQQVAWIEQHSRAGGRTFIAIRRQRSASVRLASCDELFLYYGNDVRKLFLHGLRGALPAVSGTGGPARWPWDAIKKVLTS